MDFRLEMLIASPADLLPWDLVCYCIFFYNLIVFFYVNYPECNTNKCFTAARTSKRIKAIWNNFKIRNNIKDILLFNTSKYVTAYMRFTVGHRPCIQRWYKAKAPKFDSWKLCTSMDSKFRWSFWNSYWLKAQKSWGLLFQYPRAT